jgi:hypothetical protein
MFVIGKKVIAQQIILLGVSMVRIAELGFRAPACRQGAAATVQHGIRICGCALALMYVTL